MGGESVPDGVGGELLSDAGRPAVPLDQLPETLPGHGGAPGRKEDLGPFLPVETGPYLREIALDPGLGRRPEGDEALPSPLSRNAQDPGLEVDPVPRQRDELGDAKTRGVEELEHRSVA